MLAQATGNAATSIEPAVIVAFVVGVLAFVASGGLGWVFPSARAWRRIEQRAKVLEQVHDKISHDASGRLRRTSERRSSASCPGPRRRREPPQRNLRESGSRCSCWAWSCCPWPSASQDCLPPVTLPQYSRKSSSSAASAPLPSSASTAPPGSSGGASKDPPTTSRLPATGSSSAWPASRRKQRPSR